MDSAGPITPYERDQGEHIQSWSQEPPGIVERAAGVALAPLGWVFNRIIPPSAIEALLRASDWLADKTIGEAAKQRDAATASKPEARLEELDAETDRIRNWAIAYASGEGAVAGAVGLISLPIDIPAIVTLSLRTIRRIGLVYGYAAANEAEKKFIFSVLAVAGANSMPQKVAALDAMRDLETDLIARHWVALGQRAAQRTVRAETMLLFIRDVAEQLGLNLSRRKALAAVPIVGAAIGAAMNGWYLRDVATAAQRAYQERWLRERGRLVG
jgi:hypothetical protein